MSPQPAPLNPQRVVDDLRQLDALTGGEGGSRRLAWTDQWQRARSWLTERLAETGCDVQLDGAGNLWAVVGDPDAPFVAVGSHLDSVPGGGWLDGAYGVVAGLELMRRHAPAAASMPVALRLVDWADEEGARFGKSLFGSSAVAGSLDVEATLALSDGEMSLADALRGNGLDPGGVADAPSSLANAVAFCELHIEQGPVLEAAGTPLAVVTGTVGVERQIVTLTGEAMHAGAAPMGLRRDPLLAATRMLSRLADEVIAVDGRLTVGEFAVSPGVITTVPAACSFSLDLRHPDAEVLAGLVAIARRIASSVAEPVGVEVDFSPQWRIAPVPFHPELVALASQACADLGVDPEVMASGALHDAAAVGAVIPAAMILVPSRGGISHNAVEDTDEVDLMLGVQAFSGLIDAALTWGSGVRHSGGSGVAANAPQSP